MSEMDTPCRCGHIRRKHSNLDAAVHDEFTHAGACTGSGCACQKFATLGGLTAPDRAYAGQAYARHIFCLAEVEWRLQEPGPPEHFVLWCPQCRANVSRDEITTRTPMQATR